MTSSRLAIVCCVLLLGCGESSDTPDSMAMNANQSGVSGATTRDTTAVTAPTAAANATPASAAATPVVGAAGSSPQRGAAGGGSDAKPANTPVANMPATTTPAAGMPVAMMPAANASQVDPPGTITIKTESFRLGAGEETYKCQNFDNPFGNKDAAIKRIVSEMAPGSHHLHLYHMTTSASRKLEDCTIQDFHPLLYAASSPHGEITYADGMAAKVLGSAGLRIQLHYINVTDGPLDVGATIKLSPVEYSSVTKWISELYFNQLGVRVAPGKGQTITTSCAIPNTYGPIGLVAGGTHMHKRGVRFVAKTSTGKMLADVNTWDEPPEIRYDPPIMLNPGDSISWTCTYDNDTGRTLTFGESAEDNEMCIYLARFFSAPDGAQLECQASGPTGRTSTRTY